jgi:hypothetical protein
LAATENIRGNHKPTFRLEASLLPVQRGLSPNSSSINTMDRFYVDEKCMKWLVGMRETPIGHGVIREINSRFSELGRNILISEARQPTIARLKILKYG